MTFQAKSVPDVPDAIAPDGLEVRLLVQLTSGSMAHFTVAPGGVGKAVTHRTVDELWYFVSGPGEMWLADAERTEVVTVSAGTSVSLPQGTRFQVRNMSEEPLRAVGVTMPPWPGEQEAVVVDGTWPPTLD